MKTPLCFVYFQIDPLLGKLWIRTELLLARKIIGVGKAGLFVEIPDLAAIYNCFNDSLGIKPFAPALSTRSVSSTVMVIKTRSF